MSATRLPGQPLAALIGVLVLYAGLRTALWQPLFEMVPAGLPEAIGLAAEVPALSRVADATGASASDAPRMGAVGPRFANGTEPQASMARTPWWVPVARASTAENRPNSIPAAPAAPTVPALRQSETAPSARRPLAAVPAVPFAIAASPGRPSQNRLSLDAWIFARQDDNRNSGTDPLAPGPRSAALGLSQAGVVLRYRIAPNARFDPQIYGRATTALTVREADLALGANVRPLPGLPLRLHAEGRVSRNSSGTEIRPAGFATLGIDREPLPLGWEARGYAQAGYVGGADATAFADGFVIAERAVVRIEGSAIRLGAGVWGGAQRGVERVDVGPSASVAFDLGGTPLRVSADYRVRVAGDARPGSGAALTLSTGF